ncbi:MAG: hypothetical protein RL181_1780 [Bacteroidota bacterium]|jgi:putative hemolysin
MSEQNIGWAKLTYADPGDPLLKRLLIETVEVASGRPLIERLYNQVRFLDIPVSELWPLALEKLAIPLEGNWEKLAAIPTDGPLVFIANHPFGVVDGLALASIAARIRPDFFLIANELLTRDPRIQGHILPIDFRSTRQAALINVETGREAMRRVTAGHALGIFPSGGVATAPSAWGKAEEFPWKPFTAKIITASRATVVPLFFYGQNSRLFHIVSQFSMPLRLGLLLYETKNKIGKPVRFQIGDPIPYSEMAPYRDKTQLMDYLKQKTEALQKK